MIRLSEIIVHKGGRVVKVCSGGNCGRVGLRIYI